MDAVFYRLKKIESGVIAPVTTRLIAASAAMLLAASAHAFDVEQWPAVAVPNGVQAFDVGTQMTVNGLPMRTRTVSSSLAPEELRLAFRRILGLPIVESRLGNKTVLGHPSGRYYITVQTAAALGGSRGIVAVTDLKGMDEAAAGHAAASARWLNRLPASSSIVTRMTSLDGGKSAEHLVIVNKHGTTLNSDTLKTLLLDDGYQLQRDIDSSKHDTSRLPARLADSRMLFFKGKNKEATAVIGRDEQGRTAIVLNLINLTERPQ